MKYCQNMKNDKRNRKSTRQRIYVVHPKIKWATSTGRDGEKISLEQNEDYKVFNTLTQISNTPKCTYQTKSQEYTQNIFKIYSCSQRRRRDQRDHRLPQHSSNPNRRDKLQPTTLSNKWLHLLFKEKNYFFSAVAPYISALSLSSPRFLLHAVTYI